MTAAMTWRMKWDSNPLDKNGRTKTYDIMEQKITNLYRINMRGWSSSSYVAADCQHDAIEKVAEIYDTENKFQFNVEFVAEVIV